MMYVDLFIVKQCCSSAAVANAVHATVDYQ
jgi:hypothetical protein